MSDYHTLTVTVGDGVARAAISHPPMNLLGAELLADLARLVPAVEADPSVKVLVLESRDPEYFIAHGDVVGIISLPGTSETLSGPSPVVGIIDRLRTTRLCTIAVLSGHARGGGSEVALACDLRFAAPHVRLGQPEVALGIIPGAGGTQNLARAVGRARALEIILGGYDVSAAEAADMGYINRVLPARDLGPFVSKLAARIARLPATSIRLAKQAVDAAFYPWEPGYTVEGNCFNETLGIGEHRDLMTAFLDAGGQTRHGERDVDTIIDRMLGG